MLTLFLLQISLKIVEKFIPKIFFLLIHGKTVISGERKFNVAGNTLANNLIVL